MSFSLSLSLCVFLTSLSFSVNLFIALFTNFKVTTSKQKRFPLVTFIDTPGLVDGEMQYPFNVDQAITWMGQKYDK